MLNLFFLLFQGRTNTGTAAILVKVRDVEDQPPEFIVASAVIRVPEDAPIGTTVTQGYKYSHQMHV